MNVARSGALPRRLSLSVALGCAVVGAGAVRAQQGNSYRWPTRNVHQGALDPLLPAALLPERFEGLVGEVVERRGRPPEMRWCAWRRSAREGRFWPASTVKFLVAVALLERLGELGMGPDARLLWRWPVRPEMGWPPRAGDGPPAAPLRPAERIVSPVRALVRRALVRSDNRAYDLMATFVGFRWLHERFLTEARGFERTVLQRGYGRFVRLPPQGHGTLRYSPPREARGGGRLVRLEPQWAEADPRCPEEGSCSTLLDLAVAMARLALHEQLPVKERFVVSRAALRLLRGALGARKPRGNGVVDGLRRGFGRRGAALRILHKPGYAYRWFSDVAFVHATRRSWVVALAGWPGRGALDRVAEALGAAFARGWRCAAPEQGDVTSEAHPGPVRSTSPRACRRSGSTRCLAPP